MKTKTEETGSDEKLAIFAIGLNTFSLDSNKEWVGILRVVTI